MGKAASRPKTHVRLNSAKVRRAQKAVGARTETEAIEQALDFVIAEAKRNRTAIAATKRFMSGGVEIKDVYGKLDS